MTDSPFNAIDMSKNLSMADGNIGHTSGDLQFINPFQNMMPFNSTDTGENNTILTTFKNVSIHVFQVIICISIITVKI